MFTPPTSATLIVVAPFSEISVGKPRPTILVSAFVTLSVELMSYTPGVNSRLSPADRAALICAAVLLGWTTKNVLSASDVPGVLPLTQVGPEELVCAEGTNTW